MGAAPGVEAGVQENAALSLDTDQSDASFGSSLLKKGQEALDSSPTNEFEISIIRFKK